MGKSTRVLHLLLIALFLFGYSPGAFAYFVSINADTHAMAGITVVDGNSVNTGQLAQTSVLRSLNSTANCVSGQDCSPSLSAHSEAAFTGTAALGTLSAVVNGASSQSGTLHLPSAYGAGATLTWKDTVTITQGGDFKVTLTLDSSVNVSQPAKFNCSGFMAANGSATLSLTGPVSLGISDSACAHPTVRTVTATFHGNTGQTFTFTSTLKLNTSGQSDLGWVYPATTIAVSSLVDAAHTAVFRLDPASPGAAYTTESGVFYAAVIPNQPPVAHAGADQTVHVGSTVTLDGTGSADLDGNTPLTYAWTLLSKPAGSLASLSNPSSSMPSFTTDVVGDYMFSLVVTDSRGASSLPAQVQVSTRNSHPVADAGPDQAVIMLGTTVHLNGAQSYDPDGDAIAYAWTLSQVPSGSTAVLSNAAVANPTFVADVQGTYVASLIVVDQFGAISPADLVTISFTNIKPVANAGGNQAGSVGQVIQLNGSGSSDANGDLLTYSWTFVSKPASSVAALSNPAGAFTQFTADRPGTYIISLVVNDGHVDSDPSTVTVAITSRQDQVIHTLQQAISAINALNVRLFKNRTMPHALTNKINAVLQDIDQGLYQQALDKLQNDVLAKTDGCASILGLPDKNDWILDCGAQGQVSVPIVQAITILQTLVH